jgi:hypothetical protein
LLEHEGPPKTAPLEDEQLRLLPQACFPQWRAGTGYTEAPKHVWPAQPGPGRIERLGMHGTPSVHHVPDDGQGSLN